MKTLRTQADVNKACHGRYQVGAVTIDPTEPIDLSRWIAPHECCGSCGHVEPGLRYDEDGAIVDECVECGSDLITCWGDGQVERWESGERYRTAATLDRDEGPMLGPVTVLGDSEHAADVRRQLAAAIIVTR